MVTIIFSTYQSALSQNISYVGHIGSEDGLTSQLCQEIVEDKYGNLWIGTYQSLEKYNGINTTSFSLNKQNNIQTPIKNLFVDKKGNIWVLQVKAKHKRIKGISLFRFQYNITIIEPLSGTKLSFRDYVNSDLIQEDEIRYVQQIDEVLYFIMEDNKIYTYGNNLELHANTSDTDAFLYVRKRNEIYSIKEKNVELLDKKGKQLHVVNDSLFTSFDGYSITNTGELFFYEKNQDTIYFYEYNHPDLQGPIAVPTANYSQNQLKYFLISKTADGHVMINKRLYHIKGRQNSSITDYISDRNTFDYHISNSGLIYVTTNLGVYIFENRKQKFKVLHKSENEAYTNSVRAIMISKDLEAFMKDKKERVTSPSGLYDLSFLNNQNLGSLATMHYMDPLDKSVLWSTGHIGIGVRSINLNNKKVTSYPYYKSYPDRSNFILRSSFDNNIYIAGRNGLYTIIDNHHAEGIKTNDTENLIINQIIDKNPQLWLSTSSGLLVYDLEHDTIYNNTFCSNNYSLQFIHQDKNNKEIYWLGTNNRGLIRWNIITDQCEIYDEKNGLSNNNVHAILEDNSGRLWISTNRYLNCLDKKTRAISIFSEQDGISHSEFNKHSYCIDTTNNIFYFGGLDGYTYFCPDSITTNSSENNIQIRIVGANKIKENATYENIYTQVMKNKCIEILDDDISVLIDLSSNYYANRKNREFYYRIPSINPNWTKILGNTLTLSRLPYGTYDIELVSDINKPAFKSKVITIPANIVKPFRKTWTYFILMSMAGILALWFLVKRYLKNVNDRNIRLEKLVNERTKELSELNDTKNKIFTILAHDLKNPILGMSDLAEKIKFLIRKNRLEEIEILAGQTKSRVNALNDNLNNVLAWAMSENNIQSGRKEMYSVHLEIKKILAIYSTEIEHKNLVTENNIDVIDQVYLNINVLQTILRNYIHNAVKFSYPGGIITFNRKSISQKRIILEIKDNGIGMSASNSSVIDEAANKIKQKGQGFGLGLRVSRGLAEKAGINIISESNLGVGTSVCIDMPRNEAQE